MLRKPERSLLQRLAVFSGGWTLEAAEGVCADGDVDSQDVLDLLAKLTRKSLVIADAMPEGAVRYALLETVRDYAHQKLSSRGSFEFTALRDRHATFYAVWVAHLLPIPLIETWVGTAAGLNHALLQVDAEYDNIRLMYNWCLESNQPAPGIRVGIRLHYFAESRGRMRTNSAGWKPCSDYRTQRAIERTQFSLWSAHLPFFLWRPAISA